MTLPLLIILILSTNKNVALIYLVIICEQKTKSRSVMELLTNCSTGVFIFDVCRLLRAKQTNDNFLSVSKLSVGLSSRQWGKKVKDGEKRQIKIGERS